MPWWSDVRRGFPQDDEESREDFRYTSVSKISVGDESIKAKLGDVEFTSRTVRAFKLDDLEDACEDYGQSAVYDGSIPGYPESFDIDNNHRFVKGEPVRICGNTASMVSETRYASAFKVNRGRDTHLGRFENCGNAEASECSRMYGCS